MGRAIMILLFRKENLKLGLWLLCAAGGVVSLWIAPDKTWAGAGALAAALALGLLFLFQKKTPLEQDNFHSLVPRDDSQGYRALTGQLAQKIAGVLGAETELPPGGTWEDPEVLDRLIEILDKHENSGAFLLSPQEPEMEDVLLITLMKMNYLKLFILNSIEKTEGAANVLLEEFSGLMENVDHSRKEGDKLLADMKSGLTAGGFEELKQQSELVVNSFESQSQRIQDFYRTMDTKFQKLTGAVEAIEGNLNSIIDVSEQNNVIAINASIEASKLGQKGAGFKVLVSEILKSNEKTRNFITQIGTLISHLKEYNREFTQQWSEEATKMLGNMGTTKGFSRDVISSLTQAFGTINHILDRERLASIETSKRLDKVLMSMQFQDITRQQLENVIRHMVEIEKSLEGFKQALEISGWKMNGDRPELRERVKTELLKQAKIHDERVILTALDF